MAGIEFVDVTRVRRGLCRPVLDRVSLRVVEGELMVLTGASGSGKTALLRALAGADPVESGRILIGGQDVTDLPPQERGVSVLTQGFALFPQLSVRDNIALSLMASAGITAGAVAARVARIAERCGVAEHLDARPDSLHFDLRQRVMMARALVGDPRVVCVDEPLAGAGVPVTMRRRTPIAGLQREFGVTMLYATCSSTDALAIADRIAVLERGAVQQIGTAADLLGRPATAEVAGFVGEAPMNLLPAVHRDGIARVGTLAVKLGPEQAAALTGDRVLIGLRPRDLTLGGAGGAAGAGGGAGLRAVAVLIRDVGREYLVHARIEGPDGPVDVVVLHRDGAPPVRGENLLVTANPEAAHLFDAETGRRLPD